MSGPVEVETAYLEHGFPKGKWTQCEQSAHREPVMALLGGSSGTSCPYLGQNGLESKAATMLRA